MIKTPETYTQPYLVTETLQQELDAANHAAYSASILLKNNYCLSALHRFISTVEHQSDILTRHSRPQDNAQLLLRFIYRLEQEVGRNAGDREYVEVAASARQRAHEKASHCCSELGRVTPFVKTPDRFERLK